MLMRDWGACYYVFEKLEELLIFREAADYAAWCDADEATKAEEGSGALLKARLVLTREYTVTALKRKHYDGPHGDLFVFSLKRGRGVVAGQQRVDRVRRGRVLGRGLAELVRDQNQIRFALVAAHPHDDRLALALRQLERVLVQPEPVRRRARRGCR